MSKSSSSATRHICYHGDWDNTSVCFTFHSTTLFCLTQAARHVLCVVSLSSTSNTYLRNFLWANIPFGGHSFGWTAFYFGRTAPFGLKRWRSFRWPFLLDAGCLGGNSNGRSLLWTATFFLQPWPYRIKVYCTLHSFGRSFLIKICGHSLSTGGMDVKVLGGSPHLLAHSWG